jgi:glycerate 2-kinase
MNTVRKHLSAIHGGRLAAACKAPRGRAHHFGRDRRRSDAHRLRALRAGPDHARRCPAAPGARQDETPKPGDPVFSRVQNKVIATAHRSLEAAAEVFRRNNVEPVILGDTITGEASEVAKVFASLVSEIRRYGKPWKPPVARISGGECTVTIRGEGGRGGRCSEFLLSLGIETGGFGRSPRTPTASTARRTTPAPSSPRTA